MNTTALDASTLWTPRILNYLLLDIKVCAYLVLNEIPIDWQTKRPKVNCLCSTNLC